MPRSSFQLDAYTIEPERGCVTGSSGVTHLEPKVMDLLVFLAERAGEVVSRTEIIDRVWHGTVVSDEVITRAVYQIRKAVRRAADEVAIIETVPKRGYRCSVGQREAAPAGALPPRPRLAVLPFANLSPDPANAFFADGLHEEILGALTHAAPGLEVISRTTMLRYRRKPPASSRELARELNATHVIEGSVRREGQHVRFTLQIIDARADRHLWAESYDRTLGSAMTLQTEVAADLAAQLSVRLAPAAHALAAPTRDAAAYDLYLRAKLARQKLNPSLPVEHFRVVEQTLSEAIGRDPAFALAYVERMRVRTWLVAWNYEPAAESRVRVREDLEAVRRLLPANAAVVAAAEGLYASEVEYRPERALAKFAAAYEAGYSESAFMQSMARLLLRMSRIEEALRVIQHAAAFDPGNAVLLNVSALMYLAARLPNEAARLSARAIAVGAVALGHAYVRFALTGSTREMRAFLDDDRPALDPEYRIHLSFRFLLLQRAFREAQRMLAAVSTPSVRVGLSFIGVMVAGVGRRPIAEFRGWTDLLLDEAASAAVHGRAVLEFAANAECTPTNAWFLRLLAAEGYAFVADKANAVRAAREAIELAPRSFDAVAYVEAAYVAAIVLAWCDCQDEAVVLLDDLATSTPGLGPAFVTRDPLCSTVLERHPGYRALVDSLEGQIARHMRQIADTERGDA